MAPGRRKKAATKTTDSGLEQVAPIPIGHMTNEAVAAQTYMNPKQHPQF